MTPGAPALLRLCGVSHRYGGEGAFALDRAGLEVREGEVVGILGPNGAGKSTLLRIAAGLLPPGEGRVELLGEDLGSLPARERARRMTLLAPGATFEFPLSVAELVLHGRFPHLSGLRLPGPRDLEIARVAMERTGVRDLATRDIRSLSSGERQRALLSKALAQAPRVLLLDEPTTNLDIGHQVEFLRLLGRLAREEAMGILIVSHDLNLAAASCDRALLLRGGLVVAAGAVAEVFRPGLLAEVFGIRVLVDAHPESGRPRVTLGTAPG